ncbi:TetR/AcrR family transcriptional regulator [Catenovulum sp. SM1970]|uniref:TetR/AcrR family transcriptional regulator n=1 Tax=Marinifaba aquimaris TaxID=2741323 RepID=UPI00157250E4|nr:TetR/AcrR family transcriptional regulator [Marinifaba aquimaris]NTS76110.1 TetR/AcrR family transcriptional regulator [Marinifaba aquimaris]
MSGRKRNFDTETALRAATLVFWQNGYAGTSLADLTKAMGINKPSMYSAFGNKEALFIQTIDYYRQVFAAPVFETLIDNNLSTKDKLTNCLRAFVEFQTEPSLPRGCFVSMCTGESTSAALPDSAQTALAQADESSYALLLEFFHKEQTALRLDKSLNANELVDFLLTFTHGLAVQAKAGKSREALLNLVDASIKFLPLHIPNSVS